MKKLLALLLFVATPVFAQPVQQSGAITPTHPAMWKTNGVIGDGGTPFNGALSGLGVTFSGQGICQNSAPISGPFNRICLGTTTSGGGLLTFNNFGGGAGGLVFNVNGVNYPFPFSGTGTVTSITAGANITLTPNPCISTCTIAATGGGGGGGTVTSVAGTNANGFTLAISNPTSTPNITIGTSVSGFLQGNGTTMAAAATTGSGSTLVLATSPALTTPTIAGETVSGTANFTGTFQIGGNTMTFPATAATLVYKIGAFVSGDCLQASGTAGGIADAGAACGSGGGGGGSTAHRQDFVAPGGFTPGSTTSLTLSSAPVSQNAVTVTFDGVTQAGNTWSLTGSVVSFDAAIPLNVAVVDISWLSASISAGTVTSVGLADNSTTPIFTITGTPVTLSGTLSETLMVQTANTVFAGPTTGAAAQPTFRAIVPADLPLATSGAFGAVKGDGSTLTIGSGIISCTTGTTSQLGCLKVDGTIITVSAGAITVPKSSHTVFGVVETDGSTITNSTGVISCTTATSSQIGCVEPDNTTITISAGVITAVGSSLTVGSTITGSCTSGYVVYSNDGVVGCENLAGGGNVSNSGTPTTNQLAIWTNATTIKGVTALPAANFPALTGDVTTTAASLATTVAAIQGNTVTIGGTITTAGNVTFSGAHAFTGTLTADTSVTFPTSGTLVNSGVTTLSSLVSIGTVTTGTWDATVVAGQYGGTGVANTGSTLTLGGSLATTGSNSQTLAFSSAASYIYTYPLNTGTLAELNFAQTWTAAQTFNIASTVASSSGAALDDVKIQAATSTLTGTTTVTKFNKVSLYQPTITDSSSVTVTDAATLYIDNSPLAAGSVTLTNAWAIRVGAGNVSFPGTGNLLGTITSGTWNGGVVTGQYGGTGVANTGSTITLGASITTTGAATPTLAFGATTRTYTFSASQNSTVATLEQAAQVQSGGVHLTAYSIGTESSGTYTVDCGNNPVQYLTNGGAFTFAAPANDSSCLVLVTNNASAGAITFSGFTVGSSTGDALTTTNTNKFTISIWRINGVASYVIKALQ